MEKSHLFPLSESTQSPSTWGDTITPQVTGRSYSRPKRLREPWRHSVSKQTSETVSHTIREFKPVRQRRRLFVEGILQWLITLVLSGLLAACLAGFGRLLWMTVAQIKAFNALIVLLSVFLGNNLSSSLREYALMLRWRMLAAKYRPLDEFDLIIHCDSLRKVMKLFWIARTRDRLWFYLNKTQWLCALWLGVNVLVQVLVALLGLTYNLTTSKVPAEKFGQVSVANLTLIRDIWGAENPTFDAQLGSANSYGIQGQDYSFVNATPPGQGTVPRYGTLGTPTIYANEDWTQMTYVFQDLNIWNPDLSLISHRNITTTATCESLEVLEGGNGTDSYITYLDRNGERNTLDVVRVGPGATTYVGVLNSTCGPRCTQVMALQSANGGTIPRPSFYRCENTISIVHSIERYLYDGQTADTFQMPDTEARIIAGAIGWTGFNYTPGDLYQYSRYAPESWWSPDSPADVGVIARRVMEFSIEAVAAIDSNGPRLTVSGWYPVPAQVVQVQWRWSAAILGSIPAIQLVALICVIAWGNSAIIRDGSCLSTARLLRPVVERLGNRGCLLTGQEIAEELAHAKVRYGWREPVSDLTFRNEIDPHIVRHVDILDESEGLGDQGAMPPGLYDGIESDDEHLDGDETTRLLHRQRRRRRRSM
ncbi:hypothetical protein A1O1_04170 [Capronia coronata CBS 617.96]|uniref:Uncharacterized protein n=1 Tax=Capronia coronata CBS 617.96 TaxID=1182541 RepID=W9YEU4_9EURO|nr:uncharacterized protein A1O1_04170 [Capronia coronata CBS 617.96]EXJ91063.1 hypothetical protein A1O1_04170 [Capronia coronata CBS 617.96]